MRVGLFTIFTVPSTTPDVMAAFATQGDIRGFHSIWLAEHVVLFDKITSKYPYTPDGKLFIPAEEGVLEPFTSMGYLAALTKRIRLATGVLLLPQRNPLYTAKEVSNLDYLSGGRIDLGIGIGWQREEFEALGVDWARRGARTDEYVKILKTLWCDDVPQFKGEFHSFGPCRMDPKPVQRPHPPIYIGGESEAALERTARLGQGWHGFNHSPQSAGESIGKIRQYLSKHGRSAKDVDITVGVPIANAATVKLDDVKRYRDAGVDQLTIPLFASSAQEARDLVDEVAKRVLEPAAGL